MEFLIVIEPASGGRYEHRVAPGSYVLGREEASCDIPILSPEVSRQHARIHLSAEQCSVEDLGSTAGTAKDGQALDGKQTFPFPAEVMLGTTKLTVSVSEAVEMTYDSDSVGTPTANPSSVISFNQGQPQASKPSAEVGHYTKGREIARGGMGAILEANDKMLGRMVAMKVVLEDRASEDARMRFIREATVLGQLEHPNIIPIHELGKDDDGNLFYTMKMVEGRTLQAIINDLKNGDAATIEHYTLDRLLTVFSKVCDAMAFAHSKGIVHRDLKPENVMVGAFGEVLVMDWGLAKILNDAAQTADELGQQQQLLSNADASVAESALPTGFQELTDSQMRGSSEDLTMDGAVMGSPQYMPPEQAEGRITDIDEKSDIYSLGGILYAILTLRPPINGKTVIQVLKNVKSGNITPPTDFNPGGSEAKQSSDKEVKDPGTVTALPHCPGGKVPAALSAVTMKAMAPKSSARYLAVPKLIAEIDAFQHGHSTTAEDISAIGELLLLIKRNKAVALTGFVSVILLLGLGIYSYTKVVKERNLAEAKEQEAKNAEQDRQKEADKARAAEKLAKQNAYASDMLLLPQAWDKGNIAKVHELLDRNRDLRDLHGFEWRYWTRYVRQSEFLTLKSGLGSQMGASSLSVSFHSDGKRLIANDNSKAATVRDASDGAKILEIARSAKTATCSALNGDGTLLAIGYRDHTAIVCETETGRMLQSFKGHISRLHRIAMSPDGKLVVTLPLGPNDPPRMWNASTGETVWNLELTEIAENAAFSPDGRILAVTQRGRRVEVFDVNDRKKLASIPIRSARLADVDFSPDGTILAISETWQGSVKLWSLARDRLIRELDAHGPQHNIQCIAYSPDGTRLATGGNDNTVRVLDPASGKIVQSFRGHTRPVWDVSFSPDGMRLASIDSDTTVKVWDIATEPPNEMSLYGSKGPRAVDISHDAKHVAAGTAEGAIALWNLSTGLKVNDWKGHDHSISGVAFSPDDALLATGSHDKQVRIWSMPTGELLDDLDQHNNLIRDVEFSPDGSLLAYCGFQGILKLWDVRSRRELHSFSGLTGNVESVTFSANGKWLVTAGSDKAIRIWNLASKKETAVFDDHDFGVDYAIPDPDGSVVASAGWDGSVRLWTLPDGRKPLTIKAHSNRATGVEFTPSGKRLASISLDGTVKLWNTETGREMLEIPVARNDLRDFALSHDGSRLALPLQNDAEVRVWDVRPWSREIEVESRSRATLRFLAKRSSSLEALEESIKTSTSLSDDVKAQSLEWAALFWKESRMRTVE